jgi:hypothetical protein
MRFVRILANLLKREAFFQIHELRRLGQAEQIVATGGRFVTLISGPQAAGMCWAKPPKGKNPALSRRAEETQRLARSSSERFKLA